MKNIDRFFWKRANRIAPKAPIPAASEGVAIPNMIDPKTINISPSGYITDEILAASVGDTTLVFIRNIFKYMIYKMGSIRPGTRAPKNKSAIVILSGLKIPIFNCACWYDDDKMYTW